MDFVTTFATAINYWWDQIWGNGHTHETLPTNRGWKAALIEKGSKTLLVGRPGKEGCFSVQQWPGGVLDVAVYYNTPEEVRASLLKGEGLDAHYEQVNGDICGWGLPFVYELEGLDWLE